MTKIDSYLRGYREVSQNIIDYSVILDVRNIETLPKGTGCRYLLCIKGQGTELIAKGWKRHPPDKLLKSEYLIRFM